MNLKKILGTVTAAIAITTAAVLYTTHPVKSSDHQDTYNLANAVGHNTTADITDVFVFPSPTNPNNVVFAMDVAPLIPAGMGTSVNFDPTLMWQFKISHQDSGVEDQVIQFGATGTGSSQTITMYGPSKPNEVGTSNTFVAPSGTFGYNVPSTTLNAGSNQYQVFAGPRSDPFKFDLFAFFSFLGDRDFQTHTSQNDAGPGTPYNADNTGLAAQVSTPQEKAQAAPSFAGFQSGSMSGSTAALGNYACDTGPASNALTDLNGGFNVLSFVVEVPKSVIYGGNSGFTASKIHVWATASSSTTTN